MSQIYMTKICDNAKEITMNILNRFTETDPNKLIHENDLVTPHYNFVLYFNYTNLFKAPCRQRKHPRSLFLPIDPSKQLFEDI